MAARVPEGLPVTLAGKSYTIKPLTLGQSAFVVPALMSMSGLARNPLSMDEAAIRRLAQAVYAAIKPDPAVMTLAQFLEEPISLWELSAAVPVVTQQAGLEVDEKEPGAGEALARANLIGST